MRKSTWVLLGGLVAVVPLVSAAGSAPPAQDADPTAAAEDVEEQIDEVLDGYGEAYQEFIDAYRAAETDEARSAAYEERYPDAAKYAARLWPIVEAHPTHAATARALSWIFGNHYPERDRAAALLLEHHMGSEEILVVCSAYTEPTPKAAETLTLIIEKSPHSAVKGYAMLCMGQHLMAVAENAERAQDAEDEERDGLTQHYGEAALVMWMDSDPAEVRERAEELLERVVAEFGDEKHPYGTTLGASADGILFELRNLQVGMIAPDIEGEDFDGVPFKLSDYRGKVVVLDFWGHW